jgi:hypothetical protein
MSANELALCLASAVLTVLPRETPFETSPFRNIDYALVDQSWGTAFLWEY